MNGIMAGDERTRFGDALARIFSDAGLDRFTGENEREKFSLLLEYMKTEGRKLNITSISSDEDIICKHFADSVAIAELLPQGATVADIGTGGGFPSLPLAIVRGDLRITPIDSTAKKIAYVTAAAEKLGLAGVTPVSGRAEELCTGSSSMRGCFDAVVSRAVASLPVLCELCLPFASVGGRFIAMKGPSGEAELEASRAAIHRLGGEFEEKKDFPLLLRGETVTHSAYIITKTSETPPEFPRSYAKILKKPL